MLEKKSNIPFNYLILPTCNAIGSFNIQGFMLSLKVEYAEAICDVRVFV